MLVDEIFWITASVLVAAIGPTILAMKIDGPLLDRHKVWLSPSSSSYRWRSISRRWDGWQARQLALQA
jgi:hypothetical protein